MASRDQPMDGRCNAFRDGGYCHRKRPRGGKHCWAHNGSGEPEAAKTRGLQRAAAEREIDLAIAAAVEDPKTVDVRVPLATQRVLLERTPLLASDDEVHRKAQRLIAKELGLDLVPMWEDQIKALVAKGVVGIDDSDIIEETFNTLLRPTPGDLDLARRLIQNEQVKVWALYSQRVNEGVRTMDWAATMRDGLIPILKELGVSLNALITEFVPEAERARAYERAYAITTLTIGAIATSDQAV